MTSENKPRRLPDAAKVIGITTVPPFIAAAVLTLLFFICPSFHNTVNYLLALFYLVLLPVLAYPLQRFIPGFKDNGRDGQRRLAFITANIGYTLGIISTIINGTSLHYLSVYISYFLSGAVLLFINKVLKKKASGHACGVMGPIVLCVYFIGGFTWLFLLLPPLVFWARLKSGRHTLAELITGGAVSTVCTSAALALCFLPPWAAILPL